MKKIIVWLKSLFSKKSTTIKTTESKAAQPKCQQGYVWNGFTCVPDVGAK